MFRCQLSEYVSCLLFLSLLLAQLQVVQWPAPSRSKLIKATEAPQYPFPCGLQDCLAAYLYLTRPPPEAQHKPVDPKKLVIGGDSAGAGLVLALLQVLRDTDGLELPAGAVVISPVSSMLPWIRRADED